MGLLGVSNVSEPGREVCGEESNFWDAFGDTVNQEEQVEFGEPFGEAFTPGIVLLPFCPA